METYQIVLIVLGVFLVLSLLYKISNSFSDFVRNVLDFILDIVLAIFLFFDL